MEIIRWISIAALWIALAINVWATCRTVRLKKIYEALIKEYQECIAEIKNTVLTEPENEI